MSRPALAASRAVDIINFLAGHPTASYTLSDIVKRVGINVASAHAVLRVLTDAGYLVRHPRHLCHELSLEGAVCAPADDEIVFVAHAGEYQPRGLPLHVGHRVPLVPPLGPAYVAWSDEATEGWLSRAPASATAEEIDGYRQLLANVRARGYSIALDADVRRGLGDALDQLAEEPRASDVRGTINDLIAELGHDEYQVRELDPARSYDVNTIAAPVFDVDGQVGTVLTLVGFRPGLPAAKVIEYAERLRGVALLVTKRTHGLVPRGMVAR